MKYVHFDIEDMRTGHKVLIYIASQRPDGVTATEIADIFRRDISTVYKMLKRYTLEGDLRRVETAELNNNNRPTILYYATVQGKAKVNYLMNKHTDGEWRDLPLYSDLPTG